MRGDCKTLFVGALQFLRHAGWRTVSAPQRWRRSVFCNGLMRMCSIGLNVNTGQVFIKYFPVPRRFQWNGLVTLPSNPHPGGMPEISRGLSVSDTPGGHEQTGPHPGGVPEPFGRPFSGTLAGVRQPGGRLTGGIAALNPRLISSIPPGWRGRGQGDFHSTENIKEPLFETGGSPRRRVFLGCGSAAM